jgi:hypothetical protein
MQGGLGFQFQLGSKTRLVFFESCTVKTEIEWKDALCELLAYASEEDNFNKDG